MRINRYFFTAVLFLCAPLSLSAKGVSPYLPLNLSPEIETHIDKLVALTPSTPLVKPYHAADLKKRTAQITDTYPHLANKINRYLARYNEPLSITHISAEISTSSDSGYVLANARGQQIDEEYALSAAAVAYVHPNVMLNVGTSYSPENGVTHQNTYVSLGWDVFQVDFGYREHWFSPFNDAAMLVSTHAKTSPSITFSNSRGLTPWNIRYEVFYSQLEKVDEIILGDESFPGRPRHGGVFLGLSPLPNWSIGFYRTLQFGGGERKVTFSDVLEAFFDPAGKDNVGDIETDDINFEFGNQQAAISTQINLNFGFPISLYGEYSAEDTVNESNFSLGNTTVSLGAYLPVITPSISFRAEAVDFSTAWYVHHLYPAGYTNDGVIMGHWAAGLRQPNSRTSGKVLALNTVWQIKSNQLIEATFRSVALDDTTTEIYENASEFTLSYSYATSLGIFGMNTVLAKDALGNDANRIALFYRW